MAKLRLPMKHKLRSFLRKLPCSANKTPLSLSPCNLIRLNLVWTTFKMLLWKRLATKAIVCTTLVKWWMDMVHLRDQRCSDLRFLPKLIKQAELTSRQANLPLHPSRNHKMRPITWQMANLSLRAKPICKEDEMSFWLLFWMLLKKMLQDALTTCFDLNAIKNAWTKRSDKTVCLIIKQIRPWNSVIQLLLTS